MVTPISVFISSKMGELKAERNALKELMPLLLQGQVRLEAWLYEGEAKTGRHVQDVYLPALKESALYIALLWQGYGEGTRDEFSQAGDMKMDRMIFVKDVNPPDTREPLLENFVNDINADELAFVTFEDLDELHEKVKLNIEEWVVKRLLKDTQRRTRLAELRKYRDTLRKARDDYRELLTAIEQERTHNQDYKQKYEEQHQKIILPAKSACEDAQDFGECIECEQYLDRDSNNHDDLFDTNEYLNYSYKFNNYLAYIDQIRLTHHMVDGNTPGVRQKTEVERWNWFGYRNTNAIRDAIRRISYLIKRLE